MKDAIPTWMWMVWMLMSILILYLLFRLYMTTNELDNVVLFLIKEVWSLRERCLLREDQSQRAVAWNQDALSISGVKGELLIRRSMLLTEWQQQYNGIISKQLGVIKNRIGALDNQLTQYGLHLAPITDLTLRMVEYIFNGNDSASMYVTQSIVRKLRQL